MAGVIYRRCLRFLLTLKNVPISTVKPGSVFEKTVTRQHSSSNWVKEVTASKLQEVYKSRKDASFNGEF
jgi:hypothetical protein